MSLMNEQCNKVCRILDDVLANRPTERDSLIVAVRKAFEALEGNSSESQNSWIPVSKELPKEPCKTQVTTEWAENDRTTEYVYYQGSEDKWGRLTNHVVAWAKLLDPFQPKGDES